MDKKEKTPSLKKKSSKKQTRKGLIPWIGLTLFVCAWMFVLGILVGREMVPVKFDIEKLQNDLAALKEAVIKKELDQYIRRLRAAYAERHVGAPPAVVVCKN